MTWCRSRRSRATSVARDRLGLGTAQTHHADAAAVRRASPLATMVSLVENTGLWLGS